jgi:hypothetical protein
LRSKKGALGKATPKGSAKLILIISHPPNKHATFLHRKKEIIKLPITNANFLHRKKENSTLPHSTPMQFFCEAKKSRSASPTKTPMRIFCTAKKSPHPPYDNAIFLHRKKE